jgi:hypothetical protein
VLLMSLLVCSWRSPAAEYFVATNGSDANVGTSREVPFQTLRRAASVMEPGDVCYLRQGVYRETLTPVRSGESNAPIVFTSHANESVTISGAEVVDGWQFWANGIYTTQVGWDLGEGYNQVFVNGGMAPQARYPNQGAGGLLNPSRLGVTVNGDTVSAASWGHRPVDFWAGAHFSGTVGERWSWQTARVVSSSGSTLTVAASGRSNPWFAGEGAGFAWGLLSLLDADNEWHLASEQNPRTLFLRVKDGGNPEDHTVEFKRRPWCIDVNGHDYIVVRGLHLRAGAVRMKGNGNRLESCQVRFPSHFLAYPWGYARDGSRPQGSGVLLDGTNNVVRGCTVWDSAGSGIISRGLGNGIFRNHIFNIDYSGTYACAIRLEGLYHQVAFNTAHDTGRDIIQPAGVGHSVCYNDLYRPGRLCRDLGAIYIWGNNGQCTSGRRTRIAYNWIHDHAASGPAPLVYLDNWCRNFVIDHNVIWGSTGDAGVRVNGPATGHRIYNNTLFNCEQVGTHTYNMWPDNNPDPKFWVADTYDYTGQNNLFLGKAPDTQLRNWRKRDFRTKAGAPALNSGVRLPGYTDDAVGAPDKGAYEAGRPYWTPGVNGSVGNPSLSSIGPGQGAVTLTASPGAANFQLMTASEPGASARWTPVTNAPVLTDTEWRITLPASPNGMRFYRLEEP